MKKLLVALLLIAGTQGFAQIEKGTMLAGGAFSLQTTKNNSRFSLNPNIGYFVAKNLAVGAALSVNFAKQGAIKTTELGIGPYARYYFGKSDTKPFVVAEASYLTASNKTAGIKNSSTGVGYLLGGGFAAFVSDMVAIEGIAGYNYSDFNGTAGSGGFAMRIGFQLYFNRETYSKVTSR
jgi:hypothetical protein